MHLSLYSKTLPILIHYQNDEIQVICVHSDSPRIIMLLLYPQPEISTQNYQDISVSDPTSVKH